MRTMNKIKFLRSKLKSFSDIYNGNSIPDDKKDSFVNKKIPYIATKNIDADTHQIDYENGLSVNEDDGFRIAKTKSSLLCIEGGSAGKKLGYLNQEVAFVNKLCCFTPKNIDSKFLFYSLQSSDFLSEFSLHLTGMIGGVKIGEIKNLYISYPDDLGEQHKIACFLDRKIGQIDNLISNQEEQIEKLKEYRQAIITKAVTKGLDPSVQMKDSGIESIGKVPSSWSILKSKYVFDKLVKGSGITKQDISADGDIQCVRYGEIYSKYDISFCKSYSKTIEKKIPSKVYLNYGDIVFSGTGELIEEIGKNIVYLGAEKCLAGGDIIVGKHHSNPNFLNYALYCSSSQIQKSKGKAKLKVVHISPAEIGNVFVAIPPLEEQAKIALYLDEKLSAINKLVGMKQLKIDNLKNYKKSLIYEYVTGKKRVSL